MKVVQSNKLTPRGKLMLKGKWETQALKALEKEDYKLAEEYYNRIEKINKT